MIWIVENQKSAVPLNQSTAIAIIFWLLRRCRPFTSLFFRMKSLLTTVICLATIGLASTSVAAQNIDVERPTPTIGAIAGGNIKASPLVRYLAATLQLSQEQTLVVQEAVQKHQRLTRTPTMLADCLQKVLPAQEFDRYLALQDDAAAAKSLRSLVMN